MSTPILKKSENFGDRVRAKRKALGYSQPILAEKVGASNGSVGNWETGPSIPQPDYLRKLADVLGVSVEWLLNGDEAFQEPPMESRMAQPGSTEAECRAHFDAFIRTCDTEARMGWLLVELRERFPLSKFPPAQKSDPLPEKTNYTSTRRGTVISSVPPGGVAAVLDKASSLVPKPDPK